MGTSGKTRYDKYLTNLSLAYPVGNLIGELVAPIKTVENFSDKIFVDSEDAILQVNDENEATPSSEVDFAVGTPYAYRTTRKALSSIIRNKEANNQEKKVVKLEQRETNKLTHRLRLKHEMRVVTALAAGMLSGHTSTFTATTRWDGTAPVVEENLITAIKKIKDATGASANTFIIPFGAALYLANMDFVKDTLQYQYGMELITGNIQNQVMKLIGLPPYIKGLKVIISDGRVNVNRKGEAKSISEAWGKDAYVGYVPPNTLSEELFGLLTMEYESRKISKGTVSDPNGIKILCEWDYDLLEAEMGVFYRFNGVVA